MNLFPSLVPSTRVYVPGDLPQSRMQSLSGVDASFRRGNRRIGQALNLTFTNLQEADLTLLTQHYIAVQGSFDRFWLSAEVWSGLATPPVALISDYTWRYASPMLVSHASCGRYNVDVELITEPVDLGDLVFDGSVANPTTPERLYIVDGLAAAASPARGFIIEAGGAA
jgi:hypothetical protein